MKFWFVKLKLAAGIVDVCWCAIKTEYLTFIDCRMWYCLNAIRVHVKQPCLAWFVVMQLVRDGFLFRGSSDGLRSLPVRRRSANTSSVGDECNSCPAAFWLVWLLVKLPFHCVFILIIFSDLQVEGCYLSGADRPICYGDVLGDVATDCLVVNQAIGWCDSRVPCGLERRLAVWLLGQKGHYDDDW